MRMALVALCKDFSGADLKGRKEIHRPVTNIFKFLVLNQARPRGQRRVQALQGLDASLLIEAEHATVAWGREVEVNNLGHPLLKLGVGPGQEVAQAMGFEHQVRQNPLHRGRTHREDVASASHQAGHIPHAGVRKASKLLLLSALAGHGNDGMPGQWGKNPAGDPTGANPAEPPGARQARLPRPPREATVLKGQSVYATSAPNSATCRLCPQSPDWTTPLEPAAGWSRAGPFVGAFCPRVAGLPTPAVLPHLTEFHSGARA